MDGDGVGSGFRERSDERIGGRDHQMDVERYRGDLAGGGDNARTEGDVGNEVTVHHVDMDPVGAGSGDGDDLLAQAGDVGGEDRRGDEDRGHAP